MAFFALEARSITVWCYTPATRQATLKDFLESSVVGQFYSISFGLFYLSQSTISFIYKENIIMNMNKKKSRIPYERHAGNMIPESSKKGKPFVDFNKIMKRKPVKVVKRRVKKSAV
tara:strand:+ start:191 stop:538 length:348 start_codon:yes stop_codon:yes gene_type:complete